MCRGGDSTSVVCLDEGFSPAPGGFLRWCYKICAQNSHWDGVGRGMQGGPKQLREVLGGPQLAGSQSVPFRPCHYQHTFVPYLNEAQINHSCLKIKRENLNSPTDSRGLFRAATALPKGKPRHSQLGVQAEVVCACKYCVLWLIWRGKGHSC